MNTEELAHLLSSYYLVSFFIFFVTKLSGNKVFTFYQAADAKQQVSDTIQRARDHLHLIATTEQHTSKVEVPVTHRRTASLSNQECPLYPRCSQQQQVPVGNFQVELRAAFLPQTPTGG
ncbi:SNRPN upstream reading frame protein-like [Eulemur rufifrons]|uniref:SNRPN upstream reading frame protein-like n=1 Tax=Eulemur rufifrons TaxID=859984 RepID=UPI00374313FD